MRRTALAVLLVVLSATAALAAAEAPPAEARKALDKGDLLLRAGKTADALAQFREAARRAPAYVEAQQRIQDALVALGRAAEARREYTRPAAGSAQALYLAGRIEPDLAAKEKLFRAALAKDLNYSWAIHGLGYLLEHAGRDEECEKLFRRLIELRPDSPLGPNALGFFFMQRGRNAEAEKQFDEALRRDAANTEALLNLSYLALRESKWDVAISRAKSVLAADAGNPWAHNNLGKAYYEAGRFSEAEREYKAAIAQARYDARETAYLNLSFVYRRRRDYGKAAEALRKALEINPQFAYAHNCLAQVYYHQQKFLDAWDEVHRAQAGGYQPRPEFLDALRAKIPERQ